MLLVGRGVFGVGFVKFLGASDFSWFDGEVDVLNSRAVLPNLLVLSRLDVLEGEDSPNIRG